MPIDPTDLELDYRAKNYPDSKAIERKQIACATCGKNLSAKIEKPGGVFIHPFMTTLQCKKCSDFYGDGEFSMDEDGDDKYCRMCGNGGELYICGNKPCPYGFCQKCIDRYIGKDSAEVQADDWKCLHCNCKPLWEVRAVSAVIILEKSKKRRKHRKYSTRGEVQVSDNDYNRSQDLDGDFQSFKRVSLRPSRAIANSRVKQKALEKLKEICDSSNDSSDNPDLHKSTVGKRNVNTRSRVTDAGASQSSSAKKNGPRSFKEKKRSSESEDETSDFEEKQTMREKYINSKFRTTFVEMESKSVASKKQNKQSSTQSHQKPLHLKEKNRRATESPENLKNPTSESDSESSHESANDFVRSIKKKNLKTQTQKSSKTDSVSQKKKLNVIESPNCRVDSKLSNTYFKKIVHDRKTPDSPVDSKITIRKTDNYFSKHSRTSKRRIESEGCTSESDHETYDSNKRAIPRKVSAPRVNRTNKQSSDSENEDIPKISGKVTKLSTVGRESGQRSQTKRLSTRPLTPTSQPSSSVDHNNGILDKRKSAIKCSYAKFSSSKDYVTKDQARIIKDRIGNLVSELRLFGKSLCAGANGIATKHLMNNVTSVQAVSKIVLKCALLMIRCKKSLDGIEHEFIESYESWCRISDVESLFADMEDIRLATSDKAESIIRENSDIDSSKRDTMTQDLNEERTTDHSDSDDDENCNINHQLAPNVSTAERETRKTRLGTKQKSVDSGDDLNNSSSSEKMDVNIPDPENEDSDRGSRNARHDAMSECDGEIFSDDERRTVQTEETNESRTKQICTQSPASSTSKSRLIESDSDEPGNVDRENLEEIEERSLPSDNEIEDPTNATEDRVSISQSGQDNQKKLIECSADKSPEIPARVESPSENKRQPDVSLEDIFDGADVSEHETTLMERPKDLSDGDRFLSNDLENENNSSTTEKSAPAETEVNRSSVDDVDDDDDTLDFWDRSKTNKSKSKLKASENTSSANLKENLETLSDCDATIIFTQSPYNDASNNSDADHTCENPEENLGTTEDSHMSNLEVVSDTDLPLQNDVNCTDVAGSSKERSKSPEAINELRKEVAVPDSDRNLESISDSPKTSRENIEKDMVVENDSTTLLPDNGGNDSSEGANAVENDVELDSEKEQATALDVEEEAVKKKLLESESESSEDLERIEQIPVSYDSEEAAKKKVLESESEWSEDSLAISNNFKLKMNSDSDENNKQALPADTASNTVTSEISSAGTKSDNSKEEESKMDPTDTDDSSDLNNLAKQRLLSSSASSGSDIDDSLLELPTNTILSQSRSSGENSDTDQTSDIEKEIATITYWKTKRRKFDLEKNPCYKMDKKLQIDCRVVVRRLNEKVLDQFRQLLGKSRERQEQEDFERLLDLNSIKKRKRGTEGSAQSGSSSDSSSSKTSSRGNVKKTKSKQVQEKEETLLEHLEKMKNGENCCIPSADEEDENDDVLTTIPMDTNAEGEFLAQADKLVKDFLIQNSDSENDMLASVDDTEQLEQDEEPKSESPKEKTKQKEKDKPNEEAVDSGSNHENGSNAEKDNEEETANPEEDGDSKQDEDSDSDRKREMKKLKDGLAKRNWRLTDSDSSDEEKKWDKSQLKKSDEKSEEPKELASKQKKKVKRRVLGSDSDSVKLTDDSDDSVEMIDEKKNSSSDSEDSSELFKNLRTKRRRKRNANQKSDSDSESEQDEKPAKQKRKRIKKMESDSDSDALTNSQDTPGKLHRKNIRKVLKDKQVADVTKIAGKEEEERLKRIAERQKLYNEMYEMKLASEAKVDKLVLDFDEETKKELVSVHEGLVKRLKPHQAQGIKFMWDACFESLERIKTEKGSGCIVAHCMGLGKTFQVVTLAHTLLTHPETGIKTIMVICPLSTVLNWVNEFKKWLGDINNDEDVQVFEMTKMKKNFERKYQLEKWKRAGGVMVLGYEMFRLLSNQTGKKMRKSLHEGILKCLVDPGPDLIVCDEGHLLKNEDTALSKAMRRVKTLRRIVLTGTPLQNNLVEYHCMVQFVKPNLLGTKKEFLNRFVNPITNGQFDDSTEYDVKLMKKRAHVLHKMLEGSVQRFDYSVLTPFLPPKQEYVITVRLADIQIKLYQYYLDNLSRKKVGAGTSLFADFQALQRIWTHPIVLRMNAEKMEKINEKKRLDASDTEGSLVDFLDDGSDEKTTSSEDSDVQSASSSEEKKEKPRRGTRANPLLITPKEEEEELQPQAGEWWSQFVESEHFEDMKVSSKLVLLFAILKECEQIGDKVLVFSQSLYALSLIEEFLNKIDDETQRGMTSELIDDHSGSWSLGLDYFRLDGQTPPENRSHYCRIFNNPKNSRARLFLISTRAGGLGINLTAANRVIIFDASWNPSHDVQSIFRIYRFGQKKPCYVYRFLAQGTMEEKIYNRQVTKLSLSCRVVDEQQIERHYSNHDLAELYQFEPHTSKEKPTLNLPKDRLLAEILRKYDDRIETLHEHDSLLENKAEEELDEEERKEAWKEYEDERKGRKVIMNNFAQQNFAMQQYNDLMNPADIANRATLSGINIETLQALIRKDYPNSTPEQQTLMTQRAIMDMYTYMENEAIRQQQLAASSFSYPTVSNIGTSSFIDGNVVTPAQRQYALQQQQQLHQIMVQREQQANYAKRFGNVRGPALSATATRPPLVVNLQDDNDVIEIPTTPPASTGPTPSSSVQTPAAAAPAVAENSKRQEE